MDGISFEVGSGWFKNAINNDEHKQMYESRDRIRDLLNVNLACKSSSLDESQLPDLCIDQNPELTIYCLVNDVQPLVNPTGQFLIVSIILYPDIFQCDRRRNIPMSIMDECQSSMPAVSGGCSWRGWQVKRISYSERWHRA